MCAAKDDTCSWKPCRLKAVGLSPLPTRVAAVLASCTNPLEDTVVLEQAVPRKVLL